MSHCQARVGEWLKPTVCKIVALTGYAGSNPAPGTTAHIAQLAEHALGKGEVIGSNPIVGSSKTRDGIGNRGWWMESGVQPLTTNAHPPEP